jgi:hypothetical protein
MARLLLNSQPLLERYARTYQNRGLLSRPWSEQMKAAIEEAEDLFSATAAWFRKHNPEGECTLSSFTSEDVIRLERLWDFVTGNRRPAGNEGLTLGDVINPGAVLAYLQAMGLVDSSGEPLWRRGLSRH